ncbi:MAG: hypothetical protein CML16_08085 [Pusillimonas sp.]|nr:hypothetical protein [Pusillimonas sp.]MBC42974.1 hypothetical protein [Pusillimonas sp.]HCP78118.1 hypothetical protein [Pusillimonas sp.]|tara:strand:+ start:9521 stop:10111 length:591 start_codon:yes stop_codon:yes gene_type:complete
MEKLDKWVMLLIGLVSGWLIATFPGWVDAWEVAFWWDIAAALGTISATVAAVVIASQTEIRRRKERLHQAVSLKWLAARWAGGVKTGSELLAEHLQKLLETLPGQQLPKESIFIVSLAREMIDPALLMPYVDRLYVLEEVNGRTANAVSFAWALCGHLDKIIPMLDVANEENRTIETCANQAKTLNALVVEIIDSY